MDTTNLTAGSEADAQGFPWPCWECWGHGMSALTSDPCTTCEGRGWFWAYQSRRLAAYRGGPFVGTVSRADWDVLAPTYRDQWRRIMAERDAGLRER